MILEDLAICFVPNLGTRGIVHLLDVFGNTDRIYAASEEELRVRAQLRPDIARSIAQRVGFAEAERELHYAADNEIEITAFGDELRDTIRSIHGNVKHLGRSPSKFRKNREKENELKDLKKQLKAAISNEDFENAALLRDKIRAMEKGEI